MRSYLRYLIVSLTGASLFLGACAPAVPSPTPAPAAAPASAPVSAPGAAQAPAASAKTYELKFLDQYTPQQTDGIMDELLGKLITERTGGRVKITHYHSESLGKMPDFLNLLNGGAADIVNITTGIFSAQFDFELGLEMPMLGIANRAIRSELTWELYNQGYFKGLKDYKVLAFNPTPTMIMLLKKKANTIEDLKGLKLRAADATTRAMFEKIGASPIVMPGADLYMNLERGVIDGTDSGYEFALPMKLYEVVKYAVWNIPQRSGAMFVLMNRSTWDKFPPDIQLGIEQAITDFRYEYLKSKEDPDRGAADAMRSHGMEVYDLPESEVAKLRAIADSLKAEWVAERQAKGLPAKEMMDAAAKIIGRYK